MAEANRSTDEEKTSPERALLDGQGAFFGFLIKRLGDRADAEDVLQEFCIRVLARREQLRDVERMNAWLYAILRSALNDHYRKLARRGRLVEAVAQEPEVWAEDAAARMSRLCTCPGGLISGLKPADGELLRRIDFGEEDRAVVASGAEARAGIDRYPSFYNTRRPHSSLDGRPPDQADFNQPMPEAVAA